jgi:hypothetical protein
MCWVEDERKANYTSTEAAADLTSISIAYGAATRCSVSLATGEACAYCKSCAFTLTVCSPARPSVLQIASDDVTFVAFSVCLR